ncbi:hypothetical protein R5R35_011267 [Gryllus longicercus]|uniref:Inner centromere protein ARK-binding domain-containing protein n=1 Tax=Gryllus longicercus TaxID=2509291 RepID=A0AAN9Z309_9ORTH
MNRKYVVGLLNEFMTEAQRSVDSIDEFYKEFQIWNSAAQEAITSRRSGKNVLSVPPTPGTALRIRRRLSPIGEITGDEGQGGSGNQRTSKDTGRVKSSLKIPKRTRLSFGEDDVSKVLNDPSGNSVENSQNVSLHNTLGSSLQSVPENESCDVSEERSNGRRRRKTKQSSILGRKQVLPTKRNTRSNARITRSISYEILNECDGDLKSVSNLTQENINEDNTSKRGRKSKQSSILRKVQRVSSTRISRHSVRVSNINRKTSKDEGNPLKAATDACNLNIVHEKNNGNEKECDMSQNSSFEMANNDFSQDSLNVPQVTSHSLEDNDLRTKEITTIRSADLNENHSKTQNSNSKSLNDFTQDSSNITTDTESLAVLAAQDGANAESRGSKRSSSNAKSNKSIASHLTQYCVKELSICLRRIDSSTFPLPPSEEFLKGNSERSKSEGVRKRSLNVISASEAQKRSSSFVDDDRSSKKSKCEENDKEIEVEHMTENVKETSNKPQASGIRQTGRHASSNLSETNEKNHGEFVQIESFAEIVVPPTMVENDDIFEELSKEHDTSECHKDNSMKGNSDSLESTKYYSSVDSGEIVQTDKDECPVPKKKSVKNGKLESKLCLEKKWEEALQVILEQNTPTPERAVSRKGGKSPALFSAYAKEPVKNRVAAYEGLSTVTEELIVPSTNKRITRTKTRAMAAAAAAAAAAASASAIPVSSATQQKARLNTHSHRKSGPSVKVTRASWRLKKKVNTSAKKHDASKENSFQHNSSKNTDRYYKNISGTGSKILADVNGLFSPMLQNSKKTLMKTPMTGPRTVPVNNLSASQINRSGCRPGVILSSVETFIKKPVKTVQDPEIKKLEEQKKREEKEREALRRREELLKKQAEEKKKKRDEIRLRVLEKREAQEKEKQECQLRVEKEKVEKWHILQQEREAKQKGNTLKKKLESERKAAEARRKLEEAEAARIAKLKMEELQQKKEQEEAEKERLRRIAEEKEAALLREKVEQNSKALAAIAKAKADNQKNNVFKQPVKVGKALDTTFTKVLDSTFTIQSTSKNSPNLDNAYNLEELESGDSEEEDRLPKHTARWANRPALLQNSRRELQVIKKACQVLCVPEINISAIFPRKAFNKRTSSAIWTTPPRYSVLPKY